LRLKSEVKPSLPLFFENGVRFIAADLADEEVAPADFAAVGLELDRPFRRMGRRCSAGFFLSK